MRFSCDQNEIIKQINIVSKAVSVRTTIPTLKGILMEVSGNNLKMTASDMDITIETSMDVYNTEDGQIVVPAKIFGDIVRKLPNKEIEFSVDEEVINIKCGESSASVIGMSGSDFPVIKYDESDKIKTTIDKNAFIDMVRKTYFAASIDQTKATLTGILLELDKEYFKMVAIDGFRLAINKFNDERKEEAKIIISGRLMNEMSKIFSDIDDEEKIDIIFDGKTAILKAEDIKASIRLIAGDFIKYEDVIPKESKTEVRVKRNELMDAVDRASIMSDGKNNLIKVSIKNNILVVSANSEKGGSIEEVLIYKDGEDLDIGFNAKYLIDALKAIDDEEVLLKMNTAITPCIICPVEGDKFTHLVLPVRINS